MDIRSVIVLFLVVAIPFFAIIVLGVFWDKIFGKDDPEGKYDF